MFREIDAGVESRQKEDEKRQRHLESGVRGARTAPNPITPPRQAPENVRSFNRRELSAGIHGPGIPPWVSPSGTNNATVGKIALHLRISSDQLRSRFPNECQILTARKKSRVLKAKNRRVAAGLAALTRTLRKDPHLSFTRLVSLANLFDFGPRARTLVDQARSMIRAEPKSGKSH